MTISTSWLPPGSTASRCSRPPTTSRSGTTTSGTWRRRKRRWQTWRKYILNFFDDQRLTNAFTESFNSKIRKAYRNGHGYSFEVLRAKILFSDAMQKRVRVAEQVKVKRKQRFEDVSIGLARVTHCYEMMTARSEPEYDIRTVVRIANLGTDLATLRR